MVAAIAAFAALTGPAVPARWLLSWSLMIGTLFLIPAAVGFAAGTIIGLRIVAMSRRRPSA